MLKSSRALVLTIISIDQESFKSLMEEDLNKIFAFLSEDKYDETRTAIWCFMTNRLSPKWVTNAEGFNQVS